MTGPFDRFNDRAKRVLALAQDEAIRFGHNYIGPEHLLLGLVREGEGVAAQALHALGVDLTKIRTYVESNVGRGTEERPSEITLSPQVKKIIELAVEESQRLGHGHVGTEHLILGIVRHGGGVATAALTSLGVSLEKLREQVISTLATERPRPSSRQLTDVPKQALDPVLSLSLDEAKTLGHDWLGSEHILLGLLRTKSTTRILLTLGVSYGAAHSAVVKSVPERTTSTGSITLTPRTHAILGYARGYAQSRGVELTPEILLLALSAESAGLGAQILTSLGASADKVKGLIDGGSPTA